MTDDDFAKLESAFDHPIPLRYREIMRAYPLDPSDVNSQIALVNDIQTVLAWNGELCDGEWSAEWSADRFAIGWSACGDSYFLDLTGMSPAVFMWDHESHEVSQEAPDLDHFVANQRRIEAEARERRPTQSTRRPWWKFWVGSS